MVPIVKLCFAIIISYSAPHVIAQPRVMGISHWHDLGNVVAKAFVPAMQVPRPSIPAVVDPGPVAPPAAEDLANRAGVAPRFRQGNLRPAVQKSKLERTEAVQTSELERIEAQVMKLSKENYEMRVELAQMEKMRENIARGAEKQNRAMEQMEAKMGVKSSGTSVSKLANLTIFGMLVTLYTVIGRFLFKRNGHSQRNPLLNTDRVGGSEAQPVVVVEQAVAFNAPAMGDRSLHGLQRSSTPIMQFRGYDEQDPEQDPLARLLACLCYLLPAIEGFNYGQYVYRSFPLVGDLARAVLPYIEEYNSNPVSGLILFSVFVLLARSFDLPRFVRFNIQQAIVLAIVLFIPDVLSPAAAIFPPFLQEVGTNTFFYFLVAVVGYAWVQNAQGKIPDQVPIISDAAYWQIGPY